jgi:Arc/MetJ-type ribon-helix-helix transcriptional regulator
MAEIVRGKVASGEYASESEVIRDGLSVLLARDKAMRTWLLNEVGPAYDAIQADPKRGIAASEIRAALRAEYTKVR